MKRSSLPSASFALRWVIYLLFLSAAYGKETTGCMGYVVDEGGNPIRGATVALMGTSEVATTTGDGSFQIPRNSAGCDVQIVAPGFVTATIHTDAGTEEGFDLGRIALRIEGGATEVVVHASREELAQEEVKTELSQRILGVIPNFFVTYDPKAVPLNAKTEIYVGF
jgi:hypothetical protein